MILALSLCQKIYLSRFRGSIIRCSCFTEIVKMSRLTTRLSQFTPLLGLVALIALVYRRLLFGNLILARGDTYRYFYPLWQAAADALEAGRLPLWNPDLFMGAPLLANSQLGFFYPLNWPLWLLLPTPYAVSATIVIHVLIAGIGTYWLARRGLRLSLLGALLAAVLFALGGYLSAKIELVNQIQGLAWLPCIVAVGSTISPEKLDWRGALRKGAIIGLMFAMQLLAGHTQTTFMTGIALGLWVAVDWLVHINQSSPIRDRAQTAMERWRGKGIELAEISVALGGGVLLAVTIAAIQIAPTLELTSLSRRQGGLPIEEALSFSLHPLLFPRTLLPTYGQQPSAEYVAYLPIAALLLLLIGCLHVAYNRRIWMPLILLICGLMFAFGDFNPLFKNYIVKLPGFALFRVPARWMVLYGLGGALLAGAGWDALQTLERKKTIWIGALVGAVLVVILILLVPYFATLGQTTVPMPPESPAEDPTRMIQMWWWIELIVALALILLRTELLGEVRYALWLPIVLSLVFSQATLVSQAMTTPEAYFDVRAAVARLQVSAETARANKQPTPRFLSISKGYFDPGDQGEIDSIYTDQLTEAELYLYTVVTKDREILVPNLPLVFGLSAIDGYDGGLLPLYDYAATVGVMLPEGVTTVDGRLREFMEFIPDPQWLDLFGVRHVITDRIADQWFQVGDLNVFFDLQQRLQLTQDQELNVAALPDAYESTGVWIVANQAAGSVILTHDGEEIVIQTEQVTEVVYRAEWPTALVADGLRLKATGGDWLIAGVSLVNTDNNTFSMAVPGNYRTLHAGDVKVYENLDVLPRAFVVHDWVSAENVDAAVPIMSAPDFDPRRTAVVEGDIPIVDGTDRDATVTISSYEPERITLQVDNEAAGLLVLSEAFYPAWAATIDGQPVTVQKVNGMFRGVFIAQGQHEVVFEYQPRSLTTGAVITLVGLLFLLPAYWLSRQKLPAEGMNLDNEMLIRPKR